MEAYAGSFRGIASNPSDANNAVRAPTDRPMTEMENHTAVLADLAHTLDRHAQNLEVRIARFMHTPQTLGAIAEKNPEQPEPQPGTIGALSYWRQQAEKHCQRIGAANEQLAGIL